MRLKFVAALVVILLALASAAEAQSTAYRPHPSTLFRTVPRMAISDTLPTTENHWRTGALIGGIGGAAYGVYVASTGCDGSCGAATTIGYGFITGFVGSFVGAMVGTLFPRH